MAAYGSRLSGLTAHAGSPGASSVPFLLCELEHPTVPPSAVVLHWSMAGLKSSTEESLSLRCPVLWTNRQASAVPGVQLCPRLLPSLPVVSLPFSPPPPPFGSLKVSVDATQGQLGVMWLQQQMGQYRVAVLGMGIGEGKGSESGVLL